MATPDGIEYFKAICRQLCEEKDRVSFRLCGASCEPWLNAEAAVALNRAASEVLQPSQRVIPEKRLPEISENRRMDLPIFTKGKRIPDVVIEAKVVYPWRDAEISTKIARLMVQLDEYSNEISQDRVFGILYSVWTDFWSDDFIFPKLKKPRPDLTPSEFYSRVQKQLLGAMTGNWKPIDNIEIVKCQRIPLADMEVNVGMSATWIGRTPTAGKV